MTSKVMFMMKQIKSQSTDINPNNNHIESEHCVKYHDYTDILADMEYDQEISFIARGVSGQLRKYIDKKHFYECVEPELEYNKSRRDKE